VSANLSQEDDPDADLSLNSIFSSLLTGERLQKATESKSHSADEHELTRLREALAERENEVASLTAVWNESRTKVSRMQKALERAQDLHATELETCERKAQEKLDALISKHRTEVDELARQRSTHMQNVQTDVAERDRELNQARTEAAEARAASALAVDESAKLQRLISELQSEVQALTAAADATSEAHALVVRSMREEFAKRELAKEEETRILSSTRFSSSSRESSLESHALESRFFVLFCSVYRLCFVENSLFL
jgi:type I site-specific restriction endonuclease